MERPGVASQAQNNNQAQAVASIRTNNFKNSGNLKLRLYSDNDNASVNSNVYIFQGLVPENSKVGGNKPDGTHTTLTSTQLSATASEVVDYLKNVKGHVKKITITTDDTDNFNGGNGLVLGRVGFDGRPEEAEIEFDTYKRYNGGDLNDTLTIDDQDIIIGGNFYMYVRSLKKTTTINFTIEIDGTNEGALITKRA